jgi:glycosyltransferase involved in cell wall biosynthesis
MSVANKKILAISGTPTHPRTAGNRAKLYSLLKTLQKYGYHIHFLYLTQEDYYDENGMSECWDTFDKIDYRQPPGSPKGNRLKEFCKKLLKRVNIKIVTPFKIDDWYEPAVGDYVRELTAKEPFAAAILLYVFHSKVLENINSGVLKILEAQDVFSDRHKLYLKLGMEPTFFYTTKQEEAKGLNRADLILAIQDKEKKFYESICRKPVLTIGHQVVIRNLHNPHSPGKPFRLLYIGSENPVNVEGLLHFFEEILPGIRNKIPTMEVAVAGRVCSHLPSDIPNTRLLGEVDDVESHYADAHAVINPVREGTGLKIKTIEAMGYGKPLITTPHGATGLEAAANRSYLLATTAEEFVSHAFALHQSPQMAESLAKEAYAYAEEYNRKYLAPLLEMVDNHKTS